MLTCPDIKVPTICELRTVIYFLLTKGHNTDEINCQMSKVYDNNFVSEACVAAAQSLKKDRTTSMMIVVKEGSL